MNDQIDRTNTTWPEKSDESRFENIMHLVEDANSIDDLTFRQIEEESPIQETDPAVRQSIMERQISMPTVEASGTSRYFDIIAQEYVLDPPPPESILLYVKDMQSALWSPRVEWLVFQNMEHMIDTEKYLQCMFDQNGHMQPTETLQTTDIFHKINGDNWMCSAKDIAYIKRWFTRRKHRKFYIEYIEDATFIPKKVIEESQLKGTMTDWMFKHDPNPVFGSYPKRIADALVQYSYDWDRFANGYLRFGNSYFQSPGFIEKANKLRPELERMMLPSSNEYFMERTRDIVSVLQNGIQMYGDSQPTPFVVYRGKTIDPSNPPEWLQPGGEYVYKNFVSTSINKEVAKKFCHNFHHPDRLGIVMHITVRPGTKFLALTHNTMIPNEQELLFPAGSSFTCTGKIDDHNYTFDLNFNEAPTNPCSTFKVIRLKLFT